ncbi:DUF2993 domain-containing protein [Dietzia kunjamensis]|uniref:LmeA family phospholipid-binding protein n=1 Tax=Dietzia TaxID=37914 RepID=UPI0022B3D2EB|nr:MULTISPECIES: DUF2993 domain-containing protein [Dietzia]MCZ4540884.1 DUF2993 domain-containing protein [Dietzia maris]MDJ0423985.1 DUF2993 domain-containing protein [Dietzia kunjamensis]
MQQPHDTQRLPAYDRPGVQHAETQQFAAASGTGSQGPGASDTGGPWTAGRSPGGPGSGGSGADGGSRRGRGPLIALIAALLAVGLVAALVGLEFGMRNAIKNRMSDEVTASLGSPAQVELGARPVILSYIDGNLGSVRITTDGSAADGATGPAPQIDIRADGVRTEGDLTYVDSLTGTAFVSEQTMSAAAQSEGAAGDTLLGGLIQVQEIIADPAAGTLRVSISGLAEAVVTPRLIGGDLEMQPEQASILGFPLPSEFLGGTVSMMDSALAELPEGVQLTGVRVVPGGMTVDIAGQDVVLEATE